MLMETMQGKLASSQFDLVHTDLFCVPEVTSVFFSSGDCVVGTTTTLESSIKQIEALYVFDWENAIALHAMQGNRASSLGEGEVSWVFASCGRHLGYILELRHGCPL